MRASDVTYDRTRGSLFAHSICPPMDIYLQLQALITEITAFDEECAAAEYTDVEELWDLVYRVRDTLGRVLAEEEDSQL